jgi:hypothetical protein
MTGDKMSVEPHSGDMLADFVDLLLPDLTPYETSVYLVLLRKSAHGDTGRALRIGKRTIAALVGKSARSSGGNYDQIGKVLASLAAKGCIHIGDTTRSGTFYRVFEPREVPSARARISVGSPPAALDYYQDPSLRRSLFERDGWLCHYCGESVDDDKYTLDHVVPVSRKGTDAPENLVTACLTCNSIKSGRSYEDAARDLLDSIRQRRQRRSS